MSKLFAADLRKALDFKLSEILRFDLLLGLAGGIGTGALAHAQPATVIAVSPWLAGTVGAIIGAVVAGISVQVAFLDQPFLRKLRAIGSSPIKYIAPFLFTAVIGVLGAVMLIVMACFTPTAPPLIFVGISGVGGLLGFWTVFSLIPGLDTLVQFVHLKIDALDIPDDIETGASSSLAKRRAAR